MDIFLARMASILKKPKGVVNNMFKERAVTAIRLNSLIDDPQKIYQRLRKLGFNMIKVPWIEDTYIVTNFEKGEIGRMQEYQEGLYYIQNLSSMIPALLLSPNGNEKVLDMCAAPGSKTTQLASYMNNEGKLVANDIDAWRVGKLKEVLMQFNVTNCEVRNDDAYKYGRDEQEQYDKVLLDAPCSGEGLIYVAKSMSLRFWNVKKVKGLVRIQRELIESAFKALKKGGTMIYSTCTLEPEENEGVVSYLLRKYNRAEVIEVPLFDSKEFSTFKKHVKRGILSWNSHEYEKDVHNTYRVLPSSEMMGFYIAMIKKN